jgi:hypothetical protein
MPIVVIILAIVLLAKGRLGGGFGVLVLSIVSWVLWCGALVT